MYKYNQINHNLKEKSNTRPCRLAWLNIYNTNSKNRILSLARHVRKQNLVCNIKLLHLDLSAAFLHSQIHSPKQQLRFFISGKIKISYPFRLSTSPRSCGYDDPSFNVECRNNETIWKVRYIVLDINYELYSMRLVDPTIIKDANNLSSCPTASSNDLFDAWPSIFTTSSSQMDIPVHFISCRTPVNSSKYVEGPFCGNKSSINSSSQIYSYVMVGDGSTMISDSCTVDKTLFWSSRPGRRGISDTSSLAAIYDDLGYGMEVLWFHALCGKCQNVGYCSLEGSGTQITCDYSCRDDVPISRLTFKCKLKYYEVFVFWYGLIAIGALTALKFLIGFPFLVGLMVRKWRRQHLPL